MTDETKKEPTQPAKTCCVCGAPVVDNAPHEDRWSWGPDGLHCHSRCESGFNEVLRERGIARDD